MPARSTAMLSVQVLDFEDICLLIQRGRLVSGFCTSGQRFACGFLRTPPRDDALAVRLTVPPVGSVEDLHLQVSAPCRAPKAKPPGDCRAERHDSSELQINTYPACAAI